MRPLSPVLTVLVLAIGGAKGHGFIVHPPPRNAVDRFLPAFIGGKSPPESDSCNCAYGSKGCESGARAVGNGQSCLWFSQGCSIGCPKCVGYPGVSNVSLCNGTTKSTLPKYAWTMNRDAEEGSARDTFRHNPWRSPGSAPVDDACGIAGGTTPEHRGPGVAVFSDTTIAKMGDRGSKVLPPAPSGTVWSVGAAVEVSWAIRYNHGGGYQWRLCPAAEPLTEECFQRTPLDFLRHKQSLRWINGTELPIPGMFVDEGVTPEGSTWAMNPIPRINWDEHSSGQPFTPGCSMSPAPASGKACRQFDPPCSWDTGWRNTPPYRTFDVEGACSGQFLDGYIVDQVRIPDNVPPGEYVLGWRWDCEQSTQVWSACADVTIVRSK